MRVPKLPLKFILLWIVNLVFLMALSFPTGFHKLLVHIQITDLTWLYLTAGAALAVLEQTLWDKFRGNE